MIRSTGAIATLPWHLSHLARAYAEIGEVDDAWRHVSEAMSMMDATNERWWEADVHRIAGDIALMSQQPNRPKVETHFEHALAVAREPRRSHMNAPISSFSFSMGTARTVRTPPSSMAATIKGERRST